MVLFLQMIFGPLCKIARLTFLKYSQRCNGCDSLFTTLMSLEHHKDLYDHWSDDDYDSLTDEDEDFDDDELYELDQDFLRAMQCRKNYYSDEQTEFMRNHRERSILLM